MLDYFILIYFIVESCLDIYKHNSRNPSGDYIIYQNKQAIQVYCSFEGDYGYTFISRKFDGSTINLSSMYSTKDFAKIRILKSNGEQREITVENLSSYKSRSTLSFNYDSHPNYKGPISGNKGLHPYLFLGFLPAKLATNKNIQGYRAAGKDFTFRNRDADPNSYLTFYFNPRNRTPIIRGWPNRLITQWIIHSTRLKNPHYMDRSLYMHWEMHMGGCGGLATSTVVSYTKAALGIPFRKSLLPFDTSLLSLDTSFLSFGTSLVPFDTSVLPFDTSSVSFDTSLIPFDLSILSFDKLLLPFDKSLLLFDKSLLPFGKSL